MGRYDGSKDERSYGRLPFLLWNVSKFGSCNDAAILGLMPPPLLELQIPEAILVLNSAALLLAGRANNTTIGEDAVISAYMLSVDKSRFLFGTILSRAVPAAFSTGASFS